MARFIDESFEGTGYEEFTEVTVGAGCQLVEDSTGPGSMPTGGGTQCLYAVKASGAGVMATLDSGSTRTTCYVRIYVYFTALSCGDAAGFNYFSGHNTTDYDYSTWNIGFYNDGGTYRFRLGYHTSSGWQYIRNNSYSIATGQWYRIEGKFDNAGGGSYELQVDGTSHGTGTGNLDRGAPRYFEIGGGGSYTETYTVYVDLIAIDDAAWVGAEAGPAGNPWNYYSQCV